MGTNPKSSQQALLQWLKEGLESGRLKLAPIQDEEGRILSISIILDGGGEPAQPTIPAGYEDPRKTRPL